MSNLKTVWAVDTRFSDQEPFRHPEHLVEMSEYLQKVDKPGPGKQTPTVTNVNEPARTTTPGANKKESNNA